MGIIAITDWRQNRHKSAYQQNIKTATFRKMYADIFQYQLQGANIVTFCGDFT